MVNNHTLDDAIESDSPNWTSGTCDKCGRETEVLAITHEEFDSACLVCADALAEDGDLMTIAAEARGATR